MSAVTIQESSFEKTLIWMKKLICKNRFVFLSTFVVGLLTYVFAFTNKLINHDEVIGMFGKGTGLTSGRWALDFMHYIFPDYSMPWIYGIISILLMAFSSCIIVKAFDIKNATVQVLLSGLIVAFPSLIGTFTYMFAASSYALAFLLSVAAFYGFTKEKWAYKILAFFALVISLGIYQAYISVTASLMLLFLLKDLLYSDKPIGKIIKLGIFFLIVLAASLGAYYGITQLLLHINSLELNSYASANSDTGGSVIKNIISAYSGFLDIVLIRRFCLITTKVSKIAHLLMFLFTGITVLLNWIKIDIPKKILTVLVCLLLPLSINCMFLFSSEDSIHTLVLYGFIAVYVLFSLIVDNIDFPNAKATAKKVCYRVSKEFITWCMAIVIIANIYVGNTVYFRMYLCYENMYGYYSSVMTLAKATPGFDSSSKIALVGLAGNTLHFHTDFDQLSTDITGTHGINVNSYTRQEFINNYIGTEIPFANAYEIEEIKKKPEYMEMPIYPYYGSIKKIDDYIVVKFE